MMSRGNRQEITSTGWVHEQDNDKIIRKDGQEDVLLAQEKGYNTYVKVADERCKAAKDWWKKNSGKHPTPGELGKGPGGKGAGGKGAGGKGAGGKGAGGKQARQG